MAGRYTEIEKDLAKIKNLEELIKDGIEITQECALDCEENERGCPEVNELKDIMLAYAGMNRDIKQWGIAARKTVGDFHDSYDPLGEDVDIECIFNENLAQEQSGNSTDELKGSKAWREFVESIWSVHHADEQLPDTSGTPEDEEVQIEKITGDKLLCPLTKTEMKQPVRSVHCGHTYDKTAIEGHIKRMRHKAKCPVVGCPQIIRLQELEVDRVLARELKKRNK